MTHYWFINPVFDGRIDWRLAWSWEQLLAAALIFSLAALLGVIINRLNHAGHGPGTDGRRLDSNDTEYRDAA
jgi:hypothetical protein